ncbi:MAG: flavin reductase family protein [Candidatus Eremiobacteraeota bacterium]|nr:flavin reductase family protein [Candidatus Eremiobacteraeota bacterium]
MADEAAFRAAMRHFPTGVTVVTSLREGEPRGATVSAFCSVSIEPPTVLICINREARSYLFIAASKRFCVNVLGAGQQKLAERFSGKLREGQFEGVAYRTGMTGTAILDGTIAHLECEVIEEHHVRSHSIFIGTVLDCESRPGSPLGYYGGAFHDFHLQLP